MCLVVLCFVVCDVMSCVVCDFRMIIIEESINDMFNAVFYVCIDVMQLYFNYELNGLVVLKEFTRT